MSMPAQPPEEEDKEEWMATYADAITLLMAFFVLFFSFSKVDEEKFDSVAEGLNKNMASQERRSERKELEKELAEIIIQEGADEVAKVGTDADGSITLELGGGAFFKPGGAELADQAIPVLTSIYEELASPIYQSFNISVEGHTDDDPINSPFFPSNWELSAARASTVVRFMVTNGIKKTRLKAIGMSDTQPKVPNRDEDGTPIKENMIENRRVMLRISRNPVYFAPTIPKFRQGMANKSVSQSLE